MKIKKDLVQQITDMIRNGMIDMLADEIMKETAALKGEIDSLRHTLSEQEKVNQELINDIEKLQKPKLILDLTDQYQWVVKESGKIIRCTGIGDNGKLKALEFIYKNL